ncbi:MAG: hypothetical protein ACUVQK_10490 [Thermogutta sp.]
MDMQRIASLRLEYSDRYVVVEGDRPDLARFRGRVGRVQTINCNGRAVVQFEGVDRSWYDLDLDYLKIVEAPKTSSETPAAASAATGKATSNPAEAKGESYRPSALEIAREAKEKAPSSDPLRAGGGEPSDRKTDNNIDESSGNVG